MIKEHNLQGTWKTKKKAIQKDKFDQIVKTIKYLNEKGYAYYVGHYCTSIGKNAYDAFLKNKN